MVLTVDAGNSRIKAAVFERNTLREQFVFDQSHFAEGLKNIFESYPIRHIVGAIVGKAGADEIMSYKERASINIIDSKTNFPFINNYATPQTLGIDRMVLAAGAVFAYPDVCRLVIDAGTCITYDFVDSNNIYYGGAISPGVAMRYKSLNQFTARLPLLDIAEPSGVTGNTTAASLHSGVVNGTVFEIDGFIDYYRSKHSNIIIILTGGDAVFLANRLKNTIFANSNFLLESLNQTHQYRSQND